MRRRVAWKAGVPTAPGGTARQSAGSYYPKLDRLELSARVRVSRGRERAGRLILFSCRLRRRQWCSSAVSSSRSRDSLSVIVRPGEAA